MYLQILSSNGLCLGRVLLMSDSDPPCQVLRFPIDSGAADPHLQEAWGPLTVPLGSWAPPPLLPLCLLA